MSKELVDKIYVSNETSIRGFFRENRFLSNYHECEIWFEELKYGSTEAAYQAGKLPPNEREDFTTMTPSQARKQGQLRHKEQDKMIWFEGRRLEVMNIVLFEKFKDIELRKLLLTTGDKYLEETNWWNDTYWGVCDDKGYNMLGNSLMNLRSYLKQIEYNKTK